MKKILSPLVIVLLMSAFIACANKDQQEQEYQHTDIDKAHNSQNSLSWGGVYAGEIPSASGSGIKVQLTLHYNGTYEISYKYIGKKGSAYTSTGAFTWNDAGSSVILDTKDFPPYYKVGENRLFQLDMQGNMITGNLANNYILKKIKDEEFKN
ncbi:copper resistance protein NlpE [Endomicrobium proavitum]|uniref:Putative lipoprotein n=1 Tax=Endomicrobium proavitum TaxID=1408281 RepID=A0A0G3WKU9_9BACT|nr:copper resistance protein NlpE [Endomicrobium proavitum]AKL98472.1 putative lipoprotein [Endomicrobium proavitum]